MIDSSNLKQGLECTKKQAPNKIWRAPKTLLACGKHSLLVCANRSFDVFQTLIWCAPTTLFGVFQTLIWCAPKPCQKPAKTLREPKQSKNSPIGVSHLHGCMGQVGWWATLCLHDPLKVTFHL